MNLLDRIVSAASPKAGAERAKFRAIEKTINSGIRAYEGATKSRRGDGWTAYNTSENANSDIQKSLKTLRDRSVDGYKNNASIFKAIRTIQNNVIGTGIMPTPVNSDVKLTKNDIQKIKDEWKAWAESVECDFDGFFTQYGLQSLIMRNVAMQGEMFILKRRDSSSRHPIKLQALAPHMVDHTKNSYMITERSGNYVVQGVEFNSQGKRVGYWVFDHNPNNEYAMKLQPKFVSADDMIHIFYKEFPEQVRGIPFGTSTMLSMRDLADYKDAQLMLQKVAACHVAFTTKQETAGSEFDTTTDQEIDRMEPGIIERLAPGETVTFNNPPTPSSFSEYVSKNQQENAAGYGITYEQLTGDMGNINFSSGRMGWIEAQRQIEDWQYNMFIPQFCDKIWGWFMEGLKIKMILNKNAGAEWTPQGREMIDPVKEMNGLILELKSGLISWTEACKRRGYNPDTLLEQIKSDKAMFEVAGINVDWIIEKEAIGALVSPDGSDKLNPEDLKRVLDAYGVGVRAGTITPTNEDEAYFRGLAAFPEMSEAVINAWKEDNGFRRPITLAVAKDNSDFEA
jgi:lambda family phage portal protein